MKSKKTNKSLDKIKVKSNKSLNLRNDSKVKTKSIQSSERVCNRCKVHGITVSFKGHKCPNGDCLCVKCKDYVEKNRRRNENNKKRRVEKKAIKDKSKDSHSFINSLKNKSKKILNNKSKDRSVTSSKKKKKSESMNQMGDCGQSTAVPTEDTYPKPRINSNSRRDSPPRLSRQQIVIREPIQALDSNSSTTDVEGNPNSMEAQGMQPAPDKSSAVLCAQYLRACEGLSRRLSKYQFSEDELIAALKYFIVRQSLGDIDRAANDIIFASQEIRLGASYIVQHPSEGPDGPSVRQTTSTTVQTANSVASPPILHSTMYANHRPNDGPTYRPHPIFTPILRTD